MQRKTLKKGHHSLGNSCSEITMKIVATIEARMTSKRLPGKVLLPVYNSHMLDVLVKRLKQVQALNDIVLATTTNPEDDVLVDYAVNNDLHFYRGSEENVMSRVLEAARSVQADVIVEITADCPIIDPGIIEQVIQTYLYNKADYVNNVIVRSYPDGMDVQVFSYAVLEKSFSLTSDPEDLEHVSLHICRHPELFRHINLIAPKDLYWPGLGLTLDEPDDYKLLRKIIEHFKADSTFSCGDVIDLLNEKPDWLTLNKHVKRREYDLCSSILQQ